MTAAMVTSLTMSVSAQTPTSEDPAVPIKTGIDFESEFYQELTKQSGQAPAAGNGFLEETPNGLSTKEISPECDPRRFEDHILAQKLTTAQYSRAATAYFNNCSGELTINSWKGLPGMVKYSKYQYPLLSHPQIKQITLPLADGTRIPGILALKQDPRPRPLIVIKCGVFCAMGETASIKNYMMHLFDQSPFNVLFLSNQTGLDYILLNKKISLGGWSEGYEALQAGKWLRETWEHRDRISSLHFMGISLGGNAAVIGATFNDKYLLANGEKVFKSVAAICPAIRLKPTLDKLFSSTFVGRIFAGKTLSQFRQARIYLEDVPDLLNEALIPSRRQDIPDYIGLLAASSLQRRGVTSDPTLFFKSNNFWNIKEALETPLLVWASKDDMVVNNDLNARLMQDEDRFANSEYIGVLNLKYGNHCAFSSAYGAQVSATVLRSFVLNHSPEFVDDYRSKRQKPWNFGFKKVYSRSEHIAQSWSFSAGSDEAKVRFRIFNWDGGEDCPDKGPWSGSHSCTSTRDYRIPLSDLKDMGARRPRTRAEAEALTREFNTKVEFRTLEGRPLNGTRQKDFYMTWRPYFE